MAAVVFSGFSAFLALLSPQPLLPMLSREFHAPAGVVSLVITASTIAVALAAPFVGAVADRFGRKRVIARAAMILAVPTLLAATSASLGQLMFWRFWQGVFTPGIFAVTIAYINEEWETGTGAAMSAYVSGTVFGGFSGRMVVALVATHVGWRWSFVALGILNVLSAAAIWAWLPPDRRFVRSKRQTSTAQVVLRHLRNGRLVATYSVGFCVLCTTMAAFTYVNFYLAAPPFHLTTASLGFLFTVYLVGVFVTPVAGRAIDHAGHRMTIALAFTAGIIGALLMLIQSLPAIVLGLAMVSTGSFIGNSCASSYIGTVAGEGRAVAVGLYVTCYYLGGSFGSAFPGRFWNHGGWPVCVAMIVAVQAITIVVASLHWKPGPVRPHAPAPEAPAAA